MTLLPWRVVLGAVLLVALLSLLLGGFSIGGVFVMLFGCFGILIADPGLGTQIEVTVSERRWEREITAKSRVEVEREDWCNKVPRGRPILERRDEDKSVRASRHRRRTVSREWCVYEEYLWKDVTVYSESGTGDAPDWPAELPATCNTNGCKRQGKRRETVELDLVGRGDDERTWSCPSHNPADFDHFHVGDDIDIRIGWISGSAYCVWLGSTVGPGPG